MNIIGPNLKEIRLDKGLTQEEFSHKCQLNGFNITRSTLAKIEAKVRRVTDIEVQLISEVLDISVDVLFLSDDERTPTI
ncbi:XRE family transcriptional regulator [Alteromonadaceae bacterium M269]|nr:XRE family transcriptional regulator [Alteromonadaceae bacterium M269]